MVSHKREIRDWFGTQTMGALKAVQEPASPESTRRAQERTSWFREQFLPVFQEKFPELRSGVQFRVVGPLAMLLARENSPIQIEVDSAYDDPPSKATYQQAIDSVIDKFRENGRKTYRVVVEEVHPSLFRL